MVTTFGHPATARLRNPQDFLALRRAGKRYASRFFQTQFRFTENDGARLGMAVSRRVSKRAVTRNRIRRAIRDLHGFTMALAVIAFVLGASVRGALHIRI